jgi:uncharacterized protein YggE
MQQEKPARTLYVEHTATKQFTPDVVEFSVMIETTKSVDDPADIDAVRVAVAKEQQRKDSELLSIPSKFPPDIVKIIQAETTFESVKGETKKGTVVIEQFHAVTCMRFWTTDFTTVPEISDRVLRLQGRRIYDVDFSLSDPDEAFTKVLSAAGKEAKNRAQILSAAMGLRLGPALTIKSGVLEQPRRQEYASAAPTMTARAVKSERSGGSGGGAPSELENAVIVPRAIEISATVQATYAHAE